MSRTEIVVVLGMHRSGTSLLARALHALGLRLGDELIEGKTDNPDGYWEHAGIVEITTRLLAQMRRSLPTRTGVLPLPEGWWMRPELKPDIEALGEILEREISNASGVFGFKDPRSLVLLPMWQMLFEKLETDPHYVLSLRDPCAVAASLEARDKIPPLRGETLWLRYLTDGIRSIEGRFDAIVPYEGWFVSPLEAVNKLKDLPGIAAPATETEIDSLLSPIIRQDLRHQPSDKHTPLLPLVRTLYRQLAGGRYDEAARLRAVEVSNDFHEAQIALADWSESIDELVVQQATKLYPRVNELTASLAEARARSKKLNAALADTKARAKARNEKLTAALADTKARAKARNEKLTAALADTKARAKARNEKLTAALAAARAWNKKLAADASARNENLANARARIKKLTASLAGSQEEVARLRSQKRQLITKLEKSRELVETIERISTFVIEMNQRSPAARVAKRVRRLTIRLRRPRSR